MKNWKWVQVVLVRVFGLRRTEFHNHLAGRASSEDGQVYFEGVSSDEW